MAISYEDVEHYMNQWVEIIVTSTGVRKKTNPSLTSDFLSGMLVYQNEKSLKLEDTNYGCTVWLPRTWVRSITFDLGDGDYEYWCGRDNEDNSDNSQTTTQTNRTSLSPTTKPSSQYHFDPYAILGISREATRAEIEVAYRAQASAVGLAYQLALEQCHE